MELLLLVAEPAVFCTLNDGYSIQRSLQNVSFIQVVFLTFYWVSVDQADKAVPEANPPQPPDDWHSSCVEDVRDSNLDRQQLAGQNTIGTIREAFGTFFRLFR